MWVWLISTHKMLPVHTNACLSRRSIAFHGTYSQVCVYDCSLRAQSRELFPGLPEGTFAKASGLTRQVRDARPNPASTPLQGQPAWGVTEGGGGQEDGKSEQEGGRCRMGQWVGLAAST